MARTKLKCQMPDPSKYGNTIYFLRAPDELEDQEVETRDWSDWRNKGASYAAVYTGGSRQVTVAAQVHQQVDAVIETPWTELTETIRSSDAIKLVKGRYVTYWQVIATENIDMQYMEMRFICRLTTPQGISA